jgi:hypothetical protein
VDLAGPNYVLWHRHAHLHKDVLLRLDLAARSKAHPREERSHGLAELGLGQHEEVVVPPAPHDDGCDHARLRGEKERRTGVADL